MSILKTPRQRQGVQKAGDLAWDLVQQLCEQATEGISTLQLSQQADKLLAKHRSTAPFKVFINDAGQRFGFPICVSINQEVVNGPPSDERVLKAGDVVSIALATEQNGHYGKAADTLIVGGDSQNPPIAQLIAAARDTLNQIQSNTSRYDTVLSLTKTLEEAAMMAGGVAIAETGGHGTGLAHQSEPSVYNRVTDIAEDAPPIAITEGLALVPMPMWTLPNIVDPLTPVGWKLAADGWTYETTHGGVAIHVAKTIIF
ncbi:MAG: M24 family metallopeptidase [Vampirovibrionales bacterium]|nr:M24 family metallopeptidase [Vampirovibrionales bacterium]